MDGVRATKQARERRKKFKHNKMLSREIGGGERGEVGINKITNNNNNNNFLLPSQSRLKPTFFLLKRR